MHRSPMVTASFDARRRALARLCCAVACAAAVPLCAQTPLRPTPPQTEGPFYPTSIPADHDADLTQVAGNATPAQGTRLYFTGRILARDGKPQPGADVELWQCDVYGRYHHAGDEGSPRDNGFQGYGATTTDAEGRFAFKTIRPVAYSGRVPHLHLKVRAARGTALTTQVYIAGDATDRDPVLAWSPKGTREQLTMVVAQAPGRESGALAGTFDIVLP
jgi:protocatechuate 3,4-dioxygenase beta subunit